MNLYFYFNIYCIYYIVCYMKLAILGQLILGVIFGVFFWGLFGGCFGGQFNTWQLVCKYLIIFIIKNIIYYYVYKVDLKISYLCN